MDLLSTPAIVPYRLTVALATLLGWHGHRSGSLSVSGAVCATALGYATLANPIRTFGVALLVFYFAGSRITKVRHVLCARADKKRESARPEVDQLLSQFKAAYKATLEAPEDSSPSPTSSSKPRKAGGNRSAAQVACNALIGAACAISWRILYSGEVQLGEGRESVWAKERWCVLDSGAGHGLSRPLVLAAVAFWGACAGDTVSHCRSGSFGGREAHADHASCALVC